MEYQIKFTELNTVSRVRRIIFGSVLIGIVMSASGSLGYLTLLPLLAIYPVLTGLIGEDPIDGILSHWMGGYGDHCLRPSSRIALLGVSAFAIGVAMIGTSGTSLSGVIALLSVFPAMAGMFGENLLTAVFGGDGQIEAERVDASQAVVNIKHRPVLVHDYGFGLEHGSHHKAA